MKTKINKFHGILVMVLFLSGCAGNAPRAKFITPIKSNQIVNTGDNVGAKIISDPTVDFTMEDKSRLRQIVLEQIKKKMMENKEYNAKRDLMLEIQITEYQKGNAFARAMMAGLGQMKITGTTKLIDLNDNKIITEFIVEKTFAWGGLYGASKDIGDLEKSFSESIANAVCTGK